MLDLRLEQILTEYHVKGLTRRQRPIESNQGAYLYQSGKKYLSFSSNNYLGLATHPRVIEASQQALNRYGVGSGSASLITGYSEVHQQLEAELAAFLKYPRVLLLSSGYLANTGIVSALCTKDDVIFADKFCHASLIDGCLNSKSHFRRYPHCDINRLENLCAHSRSTHKLIVTEGLFGMDATFAPLDRIVPLAAKYNASLLVDDAHAIGVLGENGRGTLELFNLGYNEVPLLIGTLGKAFGSYGAFVAGSSLVIEALIQLTRTYIYTTAIPAALAAASLASLQLIREGEQRRNLISVIRYFRQCATEVGLSVSEQETPIQLLKISDTQKALEMSSALQKKGIYVVAIRQPTVPSARLRITLTAEHTREHVDQLIGALCELRSS